MPAIQNRYSRKWKQTMNHNPRELVGLVDNYELEKYIANSELDDINIALYYYYLWLNLLS